MSSSRLLWLLISVLWVPQLAAQNVYTWVDEKGVLHFSDTPQSDKAKSIQLPDYEAQAPAPSFDSTELSQQKRRMKQGLAMLPPLKQS